MNREVCLLIVFVCLCMCMCVFRKTFVRVCLCICSHCSHTVLSSEHTYWTSYRCLRCTKFHRKKKRAAVHACKRRTVRSKQVSKQFSNNNRSTYILRLSDMFCFVSFGFVLSCLLAASTILQLQGISVYLCGSKRAFTSFVRLLATHFQQP